MLIKGLILAASLIALARVAGAQPARDGTPPDIVVAESAAFDVGPHEARAGLDLSRAFASWLPIAGDRVGQRWLAPASFFDPSARFAARVNPVVAVAGGHISRTFLPIPMVQYRRRSSLITPRGLVSIRPSIVIGRRLTWMPQFGRSGRTLGVGVQVRVWLDEPPARTPNLTPEQDGADGGIVATVRGVLDKR